VLGIGAFFGGEVTDMTGHITGKINKTQAIDEGN
jgi:hypothetical protein